MSTTKEFSSTLRMNVSDLNEFRKFGDRIDAMPASAELPERIVRPDGAVFVAMLTTGEWCVASSLDARVLMTCADLRGALLELKVAEMIARRNASL